MDYLGIVGVILGMGLVGCVVVLLGWTVARG